ncbi:MAG TPA: hypothetical protein VHP33_21295 [Polyangiaceae bacterium]|nr:hypothetical protein [Polyangiaceae bacterium]
MISQGLPIYVALEPVDMRLGYERLGGGQIIATQHLGHAAQAPKGILEAADQGLERLAECERDRAPAAESEQELEE